MSVISLEQVRADRADFRAMVEGTARVLVENAMAHGCSLADDACIRTQAHAGDLDITRVIERFVLRRGLARWRQQWIGECGREQGLVMAKMAAPIVRNTFAGRLDHISPLTCLDGGKIVPLYRERVELTQVSA